MEITDILNNINYFSSSIQWGHRNKTSGYHYFLKQKIKILLNKLSGGQTVEMLKDVLEEEDINEINNNYIQAFTYISHAVNNSSIVKSKKKHYFIRPLRQAGFSRTDVLKLGFVCSKHLWSTCLVDDERHLGGRPTISKEIINEIKYHMENLSNSSSFRTVIIKKFAERDNFVPYKKRKLEETHEAVRYRQTTYDQAFTMFNQSRPIEISVKPSTFYKYVDQRFKKPKRATDICNYCEIGKELENEIINFTNNNFFQSIDKDNYKIADLKLFYKEKIETKIYDLKFFEQVKKINGDIENFESILFHKSIATRQKIAYNQQRKDPNLLKNSILIDIDYKQKIILGNGPRILNSEFLNPNKKKVTCLGFGVYFLDNSKPGSESVNCLNIDVISDYEGTSSSDLIRVFNHVMALEAFKKIDKDKYIIWTDCGKQFRCAEFIYFLFNTLAESKKKQVSLNFFAEKHGKNMRDQHFSIVSRALEKSVFFNQKALKSAHDVVDALNQSSIYLSEKKFEKGKPSQLSIAIHYNPESEVLTRGKRTIQDLNCYYNFQSLLVENNMEFFSSVFSDLKELIAVNSTIDVTTENFKVSNNAFNMTVDTTDQDEINQNNISNIQNKKIKINNILKETIGLSNRDVESDQEVQADKEDLVMPKYCIYNCSSCKAPVNLIIEHIERRDFLNQKIILDELALHGHKKSLKIRTSVRKRMRNTQEAKQELINHYKYFH